MDQPEEIVERTVVLGYIRTSQRATTNPALQLEPPEGSGGRGSVPAIQSRR